MNKNYFKLASEQFNKFSFFTNNEKYEKSFDLFNKAANISKINNDYEKALTCYKYMIICSNKLKNITDEADCNFEIAECFKKLDQYSEIFKYYSNAKELYTIKGNFNKVAKILAAEGYIHFNLQKFEIALEKYFTIFQLYLNEGIIFKEEYFEKILECYVKLENFDKLKEILLKKIEINENHNLQKYQNKKLIFLYLLGDSIFDGFSKEKIQYFIDNYPIFDKSYEYRLILKLSDSLNFQNECQIDKILFDSPIVLNKLEKNILEYLLSKFQNSSLA